MRIIFLLLLFQTSLLYADDVTMKIFLESNNGIILIYEGIDPDIQRGIEKSMFIPLGFAAKAAIEEGRYFIEFHDGKKERKYTIQNNFWIYDEKKGIALRCSILSDLRGYYIEYLLANLKKRR